MPEKTHGDPSGVPRPVDQERADRSGHNSGIIVGEVPTPVTTTTGQQSDQYKTAFIKVYQDAGVIGVAMLTLLALCVLMAIFSSRILKMYSTLVTANNTLVSVNADATIKIATAMTIMQSQLKSSSDEFTRGSAEVVALTKANAERFERFETRVMRFLQIVASTTDPEERKRLFSREWEVPR